MSVFRHTTVPHGDDGKLVRGIICYCGHPGCETAAPLPVNVLQNSRGQDDDVEWAFIARKLEQRGWVVGKRQRDHRCPRHAPPKENNAMTGPLKLVKDTMMPTVTLPPPPPPPPKTMTRDDRRIIFEKLNEVYVDGKVGYGDDWSDDKVASNLGVPRAWVTVIRDENFGDEITSEITRAKVKEAHEIVAKIRALQPHFDEARKLLSIADRIEKDLAEIAKVMK